MGRIARRYASNKKIGERGFLKPAVGSVGPDHLRAEEGRWTHAEEVVTGRLAAPSWARDGPPSP